MSVSSSGNMRLNDANLRFYWEIPLLLSLEIAGKCPSSFRLSLLVHHSWATPTNFQANCASPSLLFHLTAQLHFHTSRPTCHHSPFCRLRPASFVRIRLMKKRYWNLSRKTRQVFRKTSGLLGKSPLVFHETCAIKPRTSKWNNKSNPIKTRPRSITRKRTQHPHEYRHTSLHIRPSFDTKHPQTGETSCFPSFYPPQIFVHQIEIAIFADISGQRSREAVLAPHQ